MRKVTHVQIDLLNRPAVNRRTLISMSALSMIGHLLFIGGIMFMPDWKPPRKFRPAVIDVNLVSLPTVQPTPPARRPKAAGKPKAPKAVAKPTRPPPPVATPQPKKAPIIIPDKTKKRKAPKAAAPPPQIKIKRSLKKETFKSSRVVQSAISRIEKEVEDQRPSPVSDAIQKLKEKDISGGIQRPGATANTTANTTAKATAKAVPGRVTTQSGSGRAVFDQLDIYKAEIPFYIQQNWAFSKSLARQEDNLEALIVIKIMPNGEIREIWFEKESKNKFFDESAYKAVQKSNPLPPLPKGYLRPFLNVGLRFTPTGLQ